MNSGPLSERMCSGTPWTSMRFPRTSITSRDVIDRSALAARARHRVLVDHSKNPDRPAVLGALEGKVIAPDVVGSLGEEGRGAPVLKATGATF